MYSFYYPAPKCFGIVTILRELTTRFHQNIQQYIIYQKRIVYCKLCIYIRFHKILVYAI